MNKRKGERKEKVEFFGKKAQKNLNKEMWEGGIWVMIALAIIFVAHLLGFFPEV